MRKIGLRKRKKLSRKKQVENQIEGKEDTNDKMAKNIKVSVKGIPQATKYVNKKIAEALKNADKGVKQATFFIKGEVVFSINGDRAEHESVDTGNFKNRITTIFPKQLQGVVFSDVDYAGILEYSPNIIAGPRAHFKNTKERNEEKIVNFIKMEVNKI